MWLLRWIDANVERIIILFAYFFMAGIIFVEVIRRFLFSEQVAWGVPWDASPSTCSSGWCG